VDLSMNQKAEPGDPAGPRGARVSETPACLGRRFG
jgi:hypothetical protein